MKPKIVHVLNTVVGEKSTHKVGDTIEFSSREQGYARIETGVVVEVMNDAACKLSIPLPKRLFVSFYSHGVFMYRRLACNLTIGDMRHWFDLGESVKVNGKSYRSFDKFYLVYGRRLKNS